jgi:hypothetical protein
MLRWKLRLAGEVEELAVVGWASGGVKWEGATEFVVQCCGSPGVGVPARIAEASLRDWERRRSWAERNCGGGRSEGRGVVAVAEGYE